MLYCTISGSLKSNLLVSILVNNGQEVAESGDEVARISGAGILHETVYVTVLIVTNVCLQLIN